MDQPNHNPLSGSAIAIIGMSCRFPGSAGPDEFWKKLRDGVEAITSFSERELTAAGVDAQLFRNPQFVAAGMVLEKADHFDAGFFGYSPKEAEVLDPQQRLFLECAWEALEDAGYDDEPSRGAVGVYAGAGLPTYLLRNTQTFVPQLLSTATNFQTMLSNDKDFLSTRVSYKLDLKGPSLTVQTACSSSLVAVHLACQSLLFGECDLALAGGVSVYFPQETGYLYQEGMIGSPDGHCRAFDADAQGTIKGNGLGIVVLKPLARALEDGDRVYAVIRGSAINNHGGAKLGYTAPSVDGQAAVVAEAQAVAEVDPATISYIESHGTGTPLGDPMEIEALTKVFRGSTDAKGFCAIGSLKTNVGHLDTAAGIASLIKTVLALCHRHIPPSLHYKSPNPQIDFANSPFFVNTQLRAWNPVRGVRRAGVSSFGIGGTNAHVVLEEAPASGDLANPPREAYLLPLSARSQEALRSQVEAWRRFLSEPDGDRWHDICHTASVRRSHHDYRLAIAAPSREIAIDKLQKVDLAMVRRSIAYAEPVFVFCGQGPQWWGMGRELREREPVFREGLEACDCEVQRVAGWSLLRELSADEAGSRLGDTEFAQPAVFALQVALARLWESWGVRPGAAVGHSVGEIAAAHVAGVLDLANAVRLVCHRARIMQRATGKGRMLALQLPEARIDKLLKEQNSSLEVAAVNSPDSTVVAGVEAEVERLAALLEERGVPCRILPGRYAFHCSQMEGYARELGSAIAGLSPRGARIPIYGAVTGRRIEGEQMDTHYWERNLRERVRFADAISEALVAGGRTFLEIGPDPVLGPMMLRSLAGAKIEGTVLHSLTRGQKEYEVMLASLGSLYSLGAPVNWRALFPSGGRLVSLPHYAWQRQRYWIESANRPAHEEAGRPLLGRRIRSPLAQVQFESRISASSPAFLSDHCVMGGSVFPAAAYIEMALAAAGEVFGDVPCTVDGFWIRRMLELPEGETHRLQMVLVENTFQIFSLREGHSDAQWHLHAGGAIRPGTRDERPFDSGASGCAEVVDLPEFYSGLASRGAEFGPNFRLVEEIRTGAREAAGWARLKDAGLNEASAYRFHPALLDACFQISLAALPPNAFSGDTYLPVGMDSLRFQRQPGGHIRVHASLRDGEVADTVVTDIRIFDEDGSVIGFVDGFRLWRNRARAPRLPLYSVSWETKPFPETKSNVSGRWFIVPDSTGFAKRLSRRLDCTDDLAEASSVLYCAGLDCHSPDSSVQTVAGVLPLLRSLVKTGGKLWIVTRGAQPVGDGPVAAEQSPLWGVGRVIAWEHPDLWGGLIDLDPATDNTDELLQYLAAPDGEEQVAFRGGVRSVPRLIAASEVPRPVYHWRGDATYLITGGLTGLGLASARHIVECGGRNLVLMGRRGPSPTASLVLNELRKSGANVQVIEADASSEHDLAKVFEMSGNSQPPLRGIIHAAGTLDDGVLLGQNAERFSRVMAPKVLGAWNLHRLTRDIPLDFFVMYSSCIRPLSRWWEPRRRRTTRRPISFSTHWRTFAILKNCPRSASTGDPGTPSACRPSKVSAARRAVKRRGYRRSIRRQGSSCSIV